MEKPPIVSNVPVDSIQDPSWNSRTTKFDPTQDPDMSFVQSIKSEGIKQPIKIRAVGGTKEPTYRLVFGSRRLAGARAAGLKEVPAIIEAEAPVNEAGVQDAIDNVIENIGRRDLSTYEQARAFARLRDLGLKNDEVCKRVGVSKSYTSRLVACYGMLAPAIVTAWSKNDPTAKVDYLVELTKIEDKAEQVKAFENRKAQLAAIETAVNTGADDIDEEEDEEETSGTNKPGPKKSFTVKADKVKALKAALKKAKAPNMTLQVIDYLIGKVDSIKGVIDAPDANK